MASPRALRAALCPTWAFVAALVALALLVRVPSYLHELYDPDEAAIASQAISMREGGTLYVDAIDRKPPLPPVIYEASFRLTGSTDLRPLHLVAALGLAGAAVALGLDARRRHGTRAGWWAGGLTVAGAVAFFPVDAQAANYAHLALLPGALAVVWARRGTVGASAAAGVALGVAILTRQSWLVGVVPGLVATWTAGGSPRPGTSTGGDDVADGAEVDAGLGDEATGPGSGSGAGWPGALIRSAVFAAGVVVAVVSAGLVAPLSELWTWVFTGTGGYVLSEVEVVDTLGRFAATVAIFVGFHLTLTVAVLVALRRRVADRSDWRHDIDLWLWLGAGCLAVVTGFRFFGHYWLQVLPPAVLLAAPLLARLEPVRRRWALAGVAVPTVLAVLFAFTPSTFRELPDPGPLAAYVRANTDPSDTVMIWGNFPEVHWVADRPPGGALVHSDFVTGRSGGREAGTETLDEASPGAIDALLRAAERRPPRLVLDTSPAGLRDYDAYPLESFPQIHRFVTENYDLTATIEGVDVWTRRDAGRPGADGESAAGDPPADGEGRGGGRRSGDGVEAGGGAGESGATSTSSDSVPRPGGDDEPGGGPSGNGNGDGGGSAGDTGRTGGTGGAGATTRPDGTPPSTGRPAPSGPVAAPTAPSAPATTAAAPPPPPPPSPPPPPPAPSSFTSAVRSIDAGLAARMSSSWRPGCPVPLGDLRYVTLTHWGFDGREHRGELVVHADAVGVVQAAFRRLHEIRFPIRSMRLVDDFGGDDDASMAADNTSAFNCRPVAGTSTWSEHSYGRAIDINPVENPYVTRSGVYPPAGAAHAARTGAPGQLVAGGEAVKAFTVHGWGWGGSWSSAKDYQHVSANGR